MADVQVNSHSFSLFEVAITAVICLSVSVNIAIFNARKRSYSIKYDLLRNKVFRHSKCLTYVVRFLFWFNNILPAVLLLSLFIQVLVRGLTRQAFVVASTGLLLLSVSWFSHVRSFYWKLLAVFATTIASQFTIIFLLDFNKEYFYVCTSCVFFSINGVLVGLTVWSVERVYWDFEEVIRVMPDKVATVNGQWAEGKLPMIVDGGLYGWFNRNTNKLVRLLLYLTSVALLIVYSYLIYWEHKNYLGAIASGAILTFDVIIFVLTSLSQKTRSPQTIMLMIFLMRLFLFVFGEQNWFAGYCLLYILVGCFVGFLVIEKRFPKIRTVQKQQTVNALKTPQFMFIILTLQLTGMILGLNFGTDRLTAPIITIAGNPWPFWLLGIASIIITLFILFYLASVRILYRRVNKIRDVVTYYFGFVVITEYHIFLLVTYCLVVILGVYFYFGLNSLLSLLACVFVPVIYITITAMGVYWTNNDFYVLADIEQYNKRKKREIQMRRKNEEIMAKTKETRKGAKKRSSKMAMTMILEKNAIEPESDSKLALYDKQEDRADPVLALDPDRKTQQTPQPIATVQPSDKQQPFTQLIDWRDPQNNIGFPHLFLFITPNDKRMLVALSACVVLLVAFSVVCKVITDSFVGLHISVATVSYVLQMSYYRCCKTHHEIEPQEIFGILAGFLVGLAYFGVFWDQPEWAVAWAAVMILLLVRLLIQTLQKQLTKLLYALQISQILLGLIFICVVINFNLPIIYLAITISLIAAFVIVVVSYYIYIKNGNSLPNWLMYTHFGLVLASTLIFMIAGFITDMISDYVVFSVTILAFVVVGLAYSSYQFYHGYSNRYEIPIVYSAYGLPNYKFDGTTQTLKKKQAHVYIHFTCLILLTLYSVLTLVFFTQYHIAVLSLCVFEVLGFYSLTWMLTNNYHSIGEKKKHLTLKVYEETFNVLKEKYMAAETEGKSSSDLLKELEELEGRLEEQAGTMAETDRDEIYDEIVHLHDRATIDKQQQQRFLFFWMALIEFRLYSQKKTMMLKQVYMAKQLRQELADAGILLQALDDQGSLQLRYDRLRGQIESLPPDKFIIYEYLVERGWERKKQTDQVSEKLSKENQERNREREKELEEEVMRGRDGEKDMVKYFKKMVKDLKKNKFQDPEFPHTEEALGGAGMNMYSHWKSFGTKKKLIKDSITVGDVKQGALGDCYLISAFGVLGHNWVCKAFGMQYTLSGRTMPSLWNNDKGAYMVRLNKFGKQIYVIVDDYLPVDENDSLIFGRCEDDEEIWVSILEKAYAKLYKSYQAIDGGKCHLVLAEFTGGFPEEYATKSYNRNLGSLWAKLMNAYENHYLLAAGSPSGSDKNHSRLGITQGHAFCIYQVRQIEDHRLLKLKNPHGSTGAQWKGDWSDESPQMSKRMMGLLNHVKSNDGMFWMCLQDFIAEFKCVYMCRIFEQSNWVNFTFEGAWTAENSMGRPQLPKIEKNPHYGIKVMKKSTVFISLTQDQKDMIKGKNYIGMRVQRNQGRRIHSQDVTTDRLCCPSRNVINARTLTTEALLEAESYPYVFSLMVYTQMKGEQGKYTIQIYSNDPNTEVYDDKEFL